MFEFEKLIVYNKSLQFHQEVHQLFQELRTKEFALQDQFKRASLSIVNNIAEGSGRRTPADKRHFYIIARGSIYECVAMVKVLLNLRMIGEADYMKYYAKLEELSKMLSGLIKY